MKFCLVGISLGIALTLAEIVLAGAGHGSYFFMSIASAPIGAGGVPFALIGTPVLWGGIGWILSKSSLPKYKNAFIAIMFLHYLTALILAMHPTSAYNDLEHFRGDYSWLYRAGLLYLCVQLVLWVQFVRTAHPARKR